MLGCLNDRGGRGPGKVMSLLPAIFFLWGGGSKLLMLRYVFGQFEGFPFQNSAS